MKRFFLSLFCISLFPFVIFSQEESTIDVPKVEITFGSGTPWSNSNWLGQNGKSYEEDAVIKISGGVKYPDFDEKPILIHGRGNYTWSNNSKSKNSYRFKFEEAQKPLDLKKGKNWLLIAQKQQGSMLSNVVGMRLAELFDVAGWNHIVPVDLYINDSYRGSYIFTEKIGFANNNIDLTDESKAAMIEIDIYQDEPIYRSNAFNIKTKVHEPNLQKEDSSRLIDAELIYRDFDRMMLAVKEQDKPLSSYIDIDKLTRYLIVNELIWNCELSEPKSVFLFSENVLDELDTFGNDLTPWIFGPIWDLDWSFGYHINSSYFQNCSKQSYFDNLEEPGRTFWSSLRNNVEVDKLYYRLWYQFMEEDGINQLYDYLEEYIKLATSSFNRDKYNETSSKNTTNYQTQLNSIKNWFNKRAEFIYSNLKEYSLEESYTLHVPASGWTSICVPFTFEVPEDVRLFKLNTNEEYIDSLKLTLVDKPKANKPYLVYGKEGDYLISGRFISTSKFSNGKKDKYLTSGCLKGTLSNIYAPVAAYILSEEKAGCFTRVNEVNSCLVNSNHAYMILPESMDVVDNYYFNTEPELSIDHIQDEEVYHEQIYNIYGQPVSASYKGFVIKRKVIMQ